MKVVCVNYATRASAEPHRAPSKSRAHPPATITVSLRQMLCPAGTFSPGGPGSVACKACMAPAGYSCPVGSISEVGLPCPAGTYGFGGNSTCVMCPGGTYGATSGVTNSSCTGSCSAGYMCPAGSTNSTAAVCPMGFYSLDGAAGCWQCLPGRFGSAVGLTSGTCSGPCDPGSYCGLGSITSTGVLCPKGRYSLGGVGVCTGCPAGRWSSNVGQNVSDCPGSCSAGYYCPTGSSSATAVLCPPGAYCPAGAGSPTVCPATAPYSGAGIVAAANCNSCTSGSCMDGFKGRFSCLDGTWTQWVDVGGVEGANACVKPVMISGNWSVSNSTCAALGSGIHLLTSKQVGGSHLVAPLPPPQAQSTWQRLHDRASAVHGHSLSCCWITGLPTVLSLKLLLPLSCPQTVDMNASGGTDLLSTALQLILVPPVPTVYNFTAFLGGYRDDSSPPWGWHWVDGSDASNLNCGIQGCSVWGNGEPKCACMDCLCCPACSLPPPT
jgi:hypothetical protein